MKCPCEVFSKHDDIPFYEKGNNHTHYSGLMHVQQFQWSEFFPSVNGTNTLVWHLYYIFTQCSTIVVTSCSWLWWWIAMHFNSYSWFSVFSTHINLHLATLISTVWTEIKLYLWRLQKFKEPCCLSLLSHVSVVD